MKRRTVERKYRANNQRGRKKGWIESVRRIIEGARRATLHEFVNYFNERRLMHRTLLLDREVVSWQLFCLFAQHARAINNFATLLLRYSGCYTYLLRVAKAVTIW